MYVLFLQIIRAIRYVNKRSDYICEGLITKFRVNNYGHRDYMALGRVVVRAKDV